MSAASLSVHKELCVPLEQPGGSAHCPEQCAGCCQPPLCPVLVQFLLSRGCAGCHADGTGDSGMQECAALAWVFVKVAHLWVSVLEQCGVATSP